MENINFLNPEFLWLLLVIPILIGWHVYTLKKQSATLKMSSLNGFNFKDSKLQLLNMALFGFRMLALVLLIVAIARPQSVDVSSKSKITQGIDIVIAVDVSSSMLARDLKPNRLEALKRVASDFVKDRVNDRIGLVVYAAESYTKSPVTSDKSIILNALREVKFDNIIDDGTAIGMGLATAINRIKDSKAASKVIILMTDGENNSGFLEPKTAAEIAKEYGIKVYTIGIGTNGMAESPYAFAPNGSMIYKMLQVKIDEKLMQEIAQVTGGKYFRATSNNKLSEIYDEINQMEKTDIEEFRYYNYDEKYRLLLYIALALLVTEFVVRKTFLKGIV